MNKERLLRPALAVLVAGVGYVGLSNRTTDNPVVEASNPVVEPTQRVPGELVVVTTEGVSAQLAPEIAKHIAKRDLPHRMVQRDGSVLKIERIKLDSQVSEEQMQQEYKKIGVVADFNYYLQKTQIVEQAEPNDPYYSSQKWYLEMMNVPGAWKEANGRGVRVGVLDTGVEIVPDLENKVVASFGPSGGAEDALDLDGHGTFVAGQIAALKNNNDAIAGIAESNIYSYRIYDKGPNGLVGTTYEMTQAIIQATNWQRTDAINISSSARSIDGRCLPSVQLAIYYAEQNNTVVVAAAGNNGVVLSQVMPANCKGVIPVTAVDRNGERPYWTNYRANSGEYALAAPGDRIYGLDLGSALAPSRVTIMSGTSMAAPHVTGGVALLKSVNPEVSAQTVRTLLYQTGQDSSDDKRGRLIDMVRAVSVLKTFFKEWLVPITFKNVS